MNSQSLHDWYATLLLPSHNCSSCREIPMMSSYSVRCAVRRALFAAAIAAGALPSSQVFAQAAPASDTEELEEVIVTGSILRRTDAETPSPVTVISSEELEQRGINTVAEAVQRLSANN